jgi:hypothetical protein
MMNCDSLIFVTYDGVENSVFESQVIVPLQNYQNAHPENSISIISFEKNPERFAQKKYPFEVIFLKKYPYCGKLSLLPAFFQLRGQLKKFNNYSIIARGPVAGFLAVQAARKISCKNLKIQARGLLAQEYMYTKQNTGTLAHIMHRFRAHLYATLEKKMYQLAAQNAFPITIEAVSPALKNYIADEYQVDKKCITIAHDDIPLSIRPAKKIMWRNQIRSELGIPAQSKVYCYNGSAKPWQCPSETIAYFKEQLSKDALSFLLLLSDEPDIFQSLCRKYELMQNSYRILHVAHANIYQYLAAADVGIVFRQPHIINWISRPTKVLEYQALGLEIAHNNTVAMLTKVTLQ